MGPAEVPNTVQIAFGKDPESKKRSVAGADQGAKSGALVTSSLRLLRVLRMHARA